MGPPFKAAVRVANGSTDPVDQLLTINYCDICNPFSYTTSIMGDPAQRSAHIKDVFSPSPRETGSELIVTASGDAAAKPEGEDRLSQPCGDFEQGQGVRDENG
jgi:hypothetical protein